MKKIIFFALLTIVFTSTVNAQWNYPQTRTVDSTETYFGDKTADPYQWIEDLKSVEVTDWFKSQSNYTDGIIDKIPNRETMVNEMMEFDKVKPVKYGSITERQGKYFFEKRLPGEEEMKLYFRNGISGDDILLFDPLNYKEGKQFSLSSWIISDDAKRILMGISESGKEVPVIKILDLDTKTFLTEEFTAAYSNGWLDNSHDTFLYLKLQGEDVHDMNTKLNSKIMMHTIGTPASEDRELLSRAHDPELNINPEDYPYIFWYYGSDYMFAGKGTVDNNMHSFIAPVSQLTSGKIDWKPFCTPEDKITNIVTNGDNAYLLTSKDASNFKILKTSLKDPDVKNAKVVFSGDNMKIESMNSSKDFLIIEQIYNGVETNISKLSFANDIVEKIDMPLKGSTTVTPLSTFSNDCYVYNTNWTTPSNIYSLNLESNSFEKGPFNIDYRFPNIENIVSEEIEVPSHDGVMVPLSIVYDKTKFNKDGSNICYLDGYGAYGFSYTPYFSSTMLPMLNRGVIFAVAHVRGGGEKGADWHTQGLKTTKPNTWKDFIACGDFLVNNGYTSKQKLAGTGTSAGGVLIGRAITERPDLFKVAIPKVGCLNTVRGEFSPNGPVNIPEFGTVAIEEEYKALKEMDAYLHLMKGEKYPATLITTGFNDPRVISWIPAKFAAKLQDFNASGNPVLLDVDYSTGHFGGETMSSYFKNLSDIYSFVLWQCGHPDFQPKTN